MHLCIKRPEEPWQCPHSKRHLADQPITDASPHGYPHPSSDLLFISTLLVHAACARRRMFRSLVLSEPSGGVTKRTKQLKAVAQELACLQGAAGRTEESREDQ